MSVRMRDLLMGELESLRREPTDERIRGLVGDHTVVDSTNAMLVWEPKRIVPTYAVPVEDIQARLVAEPAADEDGGPVEDSPVAGRRVLDPRVPFSAHTTDGEPLSIQSPDGEPLGGAAFRPFDAELAGYVLLDFDAFDAWYREDERNLGHPRDPFHRIEIVHSSRDVRVEIGGEVVAESSDAFFLFEPPLPVRYYLPREDVRTDLLEPSDTRTFCAYKGEASYWSLGDEKDVVWSYPEPLRDADEVTGRLAFFNERVDISVDGKRLERPLTPWSPRR